MKNIVIAALMLLSAGAVKAQLPAFDLKTVEGNTVNTAQIENDGRPIIIDFFATWCKPCIRELDAIAESYDDWREETGVKMIIVSVDQAQNTHKVKPLVDTHGWEYDVLLDPNSDFYRALGGNLYPYTVIVDGSGNIVYRHSGYTDGAEEELIEKVRELVAE